MGPLSTASCCRVLADTLDKKIRITTFCDLNNKSNVAVFPTILEKLA